MGFRQPGLTYYFFPALHVKRQTNKNKVLTRLEAEGSPRGVLGEGAAVRAQRVPAEEWRSETAPSGRGHGGPQAGPLTGGSAGSQSWRLEVGGQGPQGQVGALFRAWQVPVH